VKFTLRLHTVLQAAALILFLASVSTAQQPPGPQTDAPPATASPSPAAPRAADPGANVLVPAGTKIGVSLENGISTATAKPGDSVYFRTTFPITINNKVIIPVGSYMRGEITEAKRPGRIKGKGELRIRLLTLVFPNGYTVDMNAEPHSADGGHVSTDSEGNMKGPSGTGKDVTTVATTTAAGAGIGAIAGGAKGLGIGAGVGGAAGLAAVLLSRGPDAQLPRGSTIDLQLERDLTLSADQIHYSDVGPPHAVEVQQAPPAN
jgi:hypothetical protein